MDVFQAIKQDHETARRMIGELSAAGEDDAARREALFVPFKNELMIHQHVEEAVFYNRLKDEETTRPDALEAINEHHIVDSLLEELAAMPKDSDEWTAKFGVLRELVEHHMKEEEEDFFPAAREVLDDRTATRMGELMQEKKSAGLSALRPVQVD